MAGQQFTLQNTDTGAATGTTAFRVYIPWARGQYSDVAAIQLTEMVSIGGVSIDTHWESFGAPHWDGTIQHTYAVFRYNLAAGTASPTSPAVTGEIVIGSTQPTPSFASWAADIDIVIAYDEDDPVDPNSYSFSLGDIARAGGNGSAYTVETSGGSRYVFFSGWTGNGSHSSPAARRVSSDPAHSTYLGNLHVYAWLEIRTGDTHGLLEVFFANDSAYPSGTNTANPVGDVTAPDGVAYPNAPASATCASVLDQDMRRWIDAMTITISSPSATLYSAPIGVNDYSTGVGPAGTIAPSGGGWAIPIEGLGWGGGWARSWIVATGADAVPAQTKATHFGTLYGYPKVQTAQAHRRQRNLLGNSMNMAGYRWPVASGMTEAIANEGFASGPAAKASHYAVNQTNPYHFPSGHGFGSASGTYFVLGECPSPFGQFVYAGSPWHAHIAYLRTVQDASVTAYHKEIEALESLTTIFDSVATSILGYTAHWDGEDHFWTSEVQFGLRRASGQNILASYNGNTVETINPDIRFRTAVAGVELPNNRNAEHYGTLHVFWTSLILGSRMCQHFLREKGILAARQLNSLWYGNRNPSFPRAEARVMDAVTDAREIGYQTSAMRDELLLITSRRAAAHSETSGPGSWSHGIYGMADDSNTPIARRFGLSTSPTESITGRQYFPWQHSYYGMSLMRIAFARPEDTGQTDYSDIVAENARVISQICTEKLVSLDTSASYNGSVLSVPARRTMDNWFAARAAELNPPVTNGLLQPKSRGVDLARSSGTTVEFGDYVVDLHFSNAGEIMQAGAIFAICLAFPANSSVAGLIERAQAVFDRTAAYFPQFTNGREYYGSLGVSCGLFVGAGSGSGSGSSSVVQVPAAPEEGEDPIEPSDFGTLPPPGPSYSVGGGYATFTNVWSLKSPVPSLSLGSYVTSFLGGNPPDPGNAAGINTEIALPLDEPEDVRCYVLANDGTVGEAVLTGPGLVPIYHGMRRSADPVVMDTSERKLYVTNGLVRPVEYGPFGAALAGVEAPVGEPQTTIERQSLGTRDQGAESITCKGSGANITNIVGYRFGEGDVGRIVYIPSSDAFQAGNNDGPDYIGVIATVVDDDEITVAPALALNQDFTLGTLWFFPQKTTDDAPGDESWINALALVPQSTPYSAKRPVPDGTPAAGTENPLCFGFRGLHAIACKGVDQQLDQDIVVDFKGLFLFESLDTQGGGRIVLWSRYGADKKASFELSLVDNGKVQFRFWDLDLKDWRTIKSVGVCFTINEWYYLRFRYKFKNAGGWEVDERNILRSANSLPISRNMRDGLWAWSLEGKLPADRLLVVAGTHNAFDQASPATRNRSNEVGNVGYLQSDPWIGPRKGDTAFDDGGFTTERPVMFQAARAGSFQFTNAASNLYVPRWFSSNRDEPYHGNGKTQINQSAVNYYSAAGIPGTPNTANLTEHDRAVLCYIYGVDGSTEFATPRILAVVYVGANDIASVGGSATATFRLSNAVELGGDGIAEAGSGGDGNISGAGNYIMAFALPNGSNHAAAATGNTTPLPTLLVQGENPVGTSDAPLTLGSTIYVGGINREDSFVQDEDGTTRIRETAALNLIGKLDDVGFSILELDDSNDVQTADHMPPDYQFNGPVDTRLASLPQLDFTGATAQYDIGSNQTTASATWASRLDALRGRQISPVADASPNVQATLVGYPSSQKAAGEHKVVITFFDADRQQESPPGPFGRVTFQSSPDEFEPDAERRIVVTLPKSAEHGRRIWTFVYLTMPDGATYFRALEVRDNATQTVSVVVDTVTLVNQPRQDFKYSNPPICRMLRATEGRMFYAGVDGAPAAVYWSDPQLPWQVPGKVELLEASDGGFVTALGVLNGTIYAFSRGAIFAGQDLGELVRWTRIQANTGALSPTALVEMEDALFFPDDKGIFAFDGTTRVSYVSADIEDSYRSLDRINLKRARSAYSRQRDQYLITGSEGRAPYQTALYTGNIGQGGARWSRELHAQGISSLYGGSDPRTDERVVYFGTPSGFVGELDAGDRPRGQYEHELYGTLDATVLGGGGSYFVLLDLPDFDDALDGVAGVPFLIVRTENGRTSVIHRGFVWRFDGARAHTMQKVAADVRYGDQFILGGWATIWRSKKYDFGAITQRKYLQAVDLAFEPEAGGKIELAVTSNLAGTYTARKSCPMERGFDLPHVSTRGSILQVEIVKVGRRVTKIHNMALRVGVQTQRGGGDGAAT